ncbi:MAG: hypothetical protein GY816_13580 [Cytophagales bacterium]|nr:hypothetical protein [Cytophagales bacterium]
MEGSVQVQADSWMEAQGTRPYVYEELMKELKDTFQKSMLEDEVEAELTS